MALNLMDIEVVGEGASQAQPVDPNAPFGMDWVDTAPPQPTAPEMAASIEQQREAGGFPQGKPRGFMDAAWAMLKGDMNPVTGGRQQTQATRKLPELGSDLSLQQFLGDYAPNIAGGTKMAAALLTTVSPVETVQILNEATGGNLQVRPDEAGNMILSLDGREAMVNKPGMTPVDWMKLGGIALAFTPATKAATAPTIMGNALKVGAAGAGIQTGIEALQSSEGGEFSVPDIAVTAATMGGLQAIFQGIAQKLAPALRERVQNIGVTDPVRRDFLKAAQEAGFKADEVTDEMIRLAVSSADNAAPGRPIPPGQALAIAGEQEFGIPLTRGQRTGEQSQLAFEDRVRVDTSRPAAQRTILDFEQRQQLPAIDAARRQVEETIGVVDGRPGAVIRQGVQDAEKLAMAQYDDAISQVGPATLDASGMKGLMLSLKRTSRSMEFDKSLPKTSQVLGEVDSYVKLLNTFDGKGLQPTTLKTIEQMRQRLNRHISAAENPADKRQVVLLKRQFDDYLDAAVEKALFSGDPAALEALKSSRNIFSQYAKKFRPQEIRGKSGRIVDTDQAGQFIERIISANPTDEQIVNSVFGAAGINKEAGAAMARRYASILGRDSEGWAAVRHEAVRRLVKTYKVNSENVISGTNTLKALDDAMEKSPTLMRTLFTDGEIALIKRFAVQVKRTQPDVVKSRFNPSGSGVVIMNKVNDLISKIPLLASALGDPLTAAGANAVSGVTTAGKARAAIRPFQLPYGVKSAAVVGGESTLQQAK